MDSRRQQASSRGADAHEPTPFDRFTDLTKRLLHVSKDEVREAEARDRDRRKAV